MDLDFLTARSPVRQLEKGLEGGLGAGHLGLVLAGHGVGKTAFLVGLALDDLLRGQSVLHVVFDQTVAHTRAHYDTVFADLVSHARLRDEAVVRSQVERRRSICAYPAAAFGAGKLREAIEIQQEAGVDPKLVIVEGLGSEDALREQLLDLRSLAGELSAEIWLSASCPGERVEALPPGLSGCEDVFEVILALEPGPDSVELRALQSAKGADAASLHVALDPRSLLLIRS